MRNGIHPINQKELFTGNRAENVSKFIDSYEKDGNTICPNTVRKAADEGGSFARAYTVGLLGAEIGFIAGTVVGGVLGSVVGVILGEKAVESFFEPSKKNPYVGPMPKDWSQQKDNTNVLFLALLTK